MNPEVARFFAAIEPMLLGDHGAADVEAALGPSPSGREALGFYRVLVRRNLHKVLRELFPAVRTLALRLRDGLWTELVTRYAAEHPARGCHDPNRFGASFSEFLTRRRERLGDLPAVLEELAELYWVEYAAASAGDEDGDGMERRLFVRQFSHPVPAFRTALLADPDAPIPAPQSTIAIVYRSRVDCAVRLLHPRAEAMAVLARRQGLALPPPLSALDPASVDTTEVRMIEMGVLAAMPAGGGR